MYGRKFKARETSPVVRVDTTPPEVSVAVSTSVLDRTVTGQDSIVFVPTVQDGSPIEKWQLQIMDLTGRTVHLQWSTGPVRAMTWDGTDRTYGVVAPKGLYRAAFQVWDAAGNESNPSFLDLDVRVSAKEMLSRVLELITVNITDIGLIVQLDSADIFHLINGKPVVSEEGEAWLKEVALLINAYPDVPVFLGGYSRRLRNTVRDRDRSSLYAWSVYSYLVKQGNVMASRLTVRGHGREPDSERQKIIDSPPVRDGVEIILLGDRW